MKEDVVSVDSTDAGVVGTWLPHVCLDATDCSVLQNGKWLSDKHMQAAQNLLKKQFPEVGGLRTPLLSQGSHWKSMEGEGVQILNELNCHWVCMPTISCPPNVVKVWDSMAKHVSAHVKKQIAEILRSPATSLTIHSMEAQQQSGGNNCGLYLIAIAGSLCHRIPPSTVLWDEAAMQPHLEECLERGTLTPFPGWDTPRPSISHIADVPVMSIST